MAGGESSSSGSGSGGAPLSPSEDLTQPMQFKLDNIPRLTDSAGYRAWCSIATLYLRSHSLWNVVNGTETAPSVLRGHYYPFMLELQQINSGAKY